ncbi:MAG TPA: hypothetical protein DCE42_21525, partial [Myxococcales bacterium]|nr:hypothetical protein [Myxococcales bacterium]
GRSLKHLSPELLAVAFDQVGFGGAFFSLDGWMLGCNRKFNEYMELDLDPAQGIHMGRIFAEDDTFWGGSFTDFFASLSGGRRASSEILCRRSDGEEFWGFMSWGMVDNPFTKGPKVVAVSIEDISETKQSSHEVEKYIMELDRMNKELDDFVYVASHDLRSPLTAIFQLSDWLCEDILHMLPEASKEHLEMLHKRVIRMRVLLDDLLLFSRIGRHSYSVERVDVPHLLHDICNFLSFPSNSVVEIKAQVPCLQTHKVPLEMVLRSVIDNTLKHNDKDVCRVSIEVRELETELVFRIADNGPGIPRSFRDQMFGIFRKLDVSREGSGVGLAIVKKTLSLFGGRCELVSQEGEGAEFCVFWPKDTEAVLQSQKLSSTKYKSITTL